MRAFHHLEAIFVVYVVGMKSNLNRFADDMVHVPELGGEDAGDLELCAMSRTAAVLRRDK
jgi:hypothetical protein